MLTTSSLAVKTVTYESSIAPGTVGTWTKYHTLPYFDPALGRLISVDFTASLNASINGAAENLNDESGVTGAYLSADADMSVEMLNEDELSLHVELDSGTHDVDPYDGTMDGEGPSAFSASDEGNTSDTISYTDPGDVADYIGTGTFDLEAVATAVSEVGGGGNWYSLFNTWAWSYASITYTYDDLHCLSGYKIDDCTGQPLSGWTITVNNSTDSWSNDTDADGFWEICNLEDGTYTVCEELKPGWTQVDLACRTVTLAGDSMTDINFTNQELYCISGYKINSSSGTGLSGWNITLSNASGSVTKQTGPDGKYEFCNLLPGSYTVCEEAKDGWKNITPSCINVPLGCNDSNDNNFTNVPEREKACETFWANWNGKGTCLIPGCAGNWGWYLKPSIADLKAGITSDIWAAAGQCKLNKGYKVGTVNIRLDSSGKIATLHFDLAGVNDDCDLDEWHLWISDSSLCPHRGFSKWIKGTTEDIQIDLKKELKDQNGDGSVFLGIHGVACCDKCETDECTYH